MTCGSSQYANVVGTGTSVGARAVMMRYSRPMSWAVARTWANGGRRTTNSRTPSLTEYVRFDLPPVINSADRSPARKPGRSTSSHPRRASRSSPCAMSVLRSAGDIDDLARDEACTLARQKRHGMGDVFGLSDAGDGDGLCGAGLEVLERDAHPGRGLCRHLGLDEARRDGVRGDAELAEFDGEGLRESLHSCLRGRIVRLSAVAEGRCARQVDDAAELGFGHEFLCGLAHQEGATQVHIHDGVPVGDRHLEQQVVADDARIVDQNRRGAEFADDFFESGLYGRLV